MGGGVDCWSVPVRRPAIAGELHRTSPLRSALGQRRILVFWRLAPTTTPVHKPEPPVPRPRTPGSRFLVSSQRVVVDAGRRRAERERRLARRRVGARLGEQRMPMLFPVVHMLKSYVPHHQTSASSARSASSNGR